VVEWGGLENLRRPSCPIPNSVNVYGFPTILAYRISPSSRPIPARATELGGKLGGNLPSNSDQPPQIGQLGFG